MGISSWGVLGLSLQKYIVGTKFKTTWRQWPQDSVRNLCFSKEKQQFTFIFYIPPLLIFLFCFSLVFINSVL